MNKLEGQLKKFVVDNYKDYSGDLFSVFIYKNFDFCVKDGYSAFMTPFVWMFIKTYEKLREYIIRNKAISSLIQMEYSAFEEATVPICAFVLKNGISKEPSYCIRLSEFKGGMEVQKIKTVEALKNKMCGYFYESSQNNYLMIPGQPIAYWSSQSIIEAFENCDSLVNVARTRQGLASSDNNRFLKLWWEPQFNKIGYGSE
ncbi:MAG: Eco57I restriction-modification methylase domain-containing protein [Eubacteriales bacterium]